MAYKTIDIKMYKSRLMEIREEAEQETEAVKRELLFKLVDWLVIKLEEWHKKLKEYENAFNESEQSNGEHDKYKSQLMDNYFNHLRAAGRLFYLYTALRIIRSEGEDWEGDASSVNAVLDHVLKLIG